MATANINAKTAISGAQPTRVKERLAILGIGLLVNTFFNYAFDYVLYPYVIWKMGVLKGGLIMAVLSALVCYLMLLFYDWSKKDWLGLETVKSLKNYKGTVRLGKITSWFLKRNDPFIMLLLSIKYDAFITTAYMRHGTYQYSGLSKRDWKIFLLSFAVSNLYWILASFMGITFIEYLWGTVFR